MRTREEIEAKIAEIDATDPDGKGLSAQNENYRDVLEEALEFVDGHGEQYGWLATATSWANGDIPALRIEGYPPEAPGELEGPDA